jgi:hypothetical protein
MHYLNISMPRLSHAEVDVSVFPCKVMSIRAYILVFAVYMALGVLRNGYLAQMSGVTTGSNFTSMVYNQALFKRLYK